MSKQAGHDTGWASSIAGTVAVGLAVLLTGTCGAEAATNHTVVGWNNLGMHCVDRDFSVFTILPPYNTIHAQVIRGTNGTASRLTNGVTVTYRAVPDASGSINTTSRGKGNFWDYVQPIFGVSAQEDTGLPVPGPGAYAMPGTNNAPQAMGWETASGWFAAYGIPILPYDDAGKPNQYPLMRLTASNTLGQVVATNDIVLPVSDEMNCVFCHLSDSVAAARPSAGWENDPHPGRDYRLNVIRLHDERRFADSPALYASALASNHFDAAGLYVTIVSNQHPILCAACHLSEALPGSGLPALGIKPLTASVHGYHAGVVDPRNPPYTLDTETNQIACYYCHPGNITRCLRGAMGKAVNPANGNMAMQCQSCHGNMSDVGRTNRTGWLDEPNCQACHTGHALSNSGQIRYTSVFGSNGALRVPTNTVFATTADAPLAGKSLYRFSSGHGGIKCAGCHGSTHAEFPSAYPNDNVASIQHQKHEGVLAECDTCHGAMPSTVSGGPHGMHPLGSPWVSSHRSNAGSSCRACHGTNYTGTVLSRMQANRTINGQNVFRYQQIGCYNCHNGSGGSGSAPAAPTASNATAGTAAGVPVTITLTASTGTLRVVSQPAFGTVAMNGKAATYYPVRGFAGTETFTFTANNGFRDSNLATVTVTVTNVYSQADGIPDWWRQVNFGSLTSAVAAAAADPDGDQFNNYQEFTAGTDPNDRRSNLRLFAITVGRTRTTLGFASLLGGRYGVERRDNLMTGAWTSVNTNVWGMTDVTEVNDTNAVPTSRFYRVRTP